MSLFEKISVNRNNEEYSWLRLSFIITKQFFIPWHFLVLNTYSDGFWKCLIWLRCLWIYVEFLGDVLWNVSKSPLSLCLERRFSLYATHRIHQFFSWKKELSCCQKCLLFLSTFCPSTILSSGIWEEMWSEKAIEFYIQASQLTLSHS